MVANPEDIEIDEGEGDEEMEEEIDAPAEKAVPVRISMVSLSPWKRQ